jgi:hypothetical protein
LETTPFPSRKRIIQHALCGFGNKAQQGRKKAAIAKKPDFM